MPKTTEEQVKETFDDFDADHSGFIERKEIENVCKALGVDASKEQISLLITESDTNGDGKISYEEFKASILG